MVELDELLSELAERAGVVRESGELGVVCARKIGGGEGGAVLERSRELSGCQVREKTRRAHPLIARVKVRKIADRGNRREVERQKTDSLSACIIRSRAKRSAVVIAASERDATPVVDEHSWETAALRPCAGRKIARVE